jgi:hypothetical protein
MYSTIVLDCQTKKTSFSCEDCIAYKTCKIHGEIDQTENKAKDATLQVMIDDGAVTSKKHAVQRST